MISMKRIIVGFIALLGIVLSLALGISSEKPIGEVRGMVTLAEFKDAPLENCTVYLNGQNGSVAREVQ
jgi:hypothetical protein